LRKRFELPWIKKKIPEFLNPLVEPIVSDVEEALSKAGKTASQSVSTVLGALS